MKPQMQGTIQYRLLFKGLLLFLIAGLWSCENSDRIGLEITPPGERFAYHIDSETLVKARTLRQDSLSSEKRERSLMGAMADPVFGKTRAGFLTQLRLSSNDVDFGENAQLDSAVILLKYRKSYGDTTSLQHIRVHELTKDLYVDSVYYSNIDPGIYHDESQPAAEMDYYPTPSADSLIIRLDDRIGEKILFADTSHLQDNTSFLDFFKGLYIEAAEVETGGSVVSYDLAGGKSRMIIYYSNSEEDSLKYEVVINSNCTWFNVFEHDYSGAEAEPFINDSIFGYGQLYLQSMAGLRTHAFFEFSDTLMQMAETGISVNKAELTIPVDLDYIAGDKPAPVSLQIFYALDDGTNEFISDIFLGDDYHGGFYDKNTGKYTFNIAKYVQGLLNPDPNIRLKNTGIFIINKDARIAADQVVLKNGPEEEKISLVITYTVIN